MGPGSTTGDNRQAMTVAAMGLTTHSVVRLLRSSTVRCIYLQVPYPIGPGAAVGVDFAGQPPCERALQALHRLSQGSRV